MRPCVRLWPLLLLLTTLPSPVAAVREPVARDDGPPVNNPDTEAALRRFELELQRESLSVDFSLEQTLVNEPLFDGNSNAFGILEPVEVPPVTIICTRCCTHGNIKATLTGKSTQDAKIRFDLTDVEGYIELDILTKNLVTFQVPMFRTPPGPLGVDIPGGPKLGLIFTIDMIFDIGAAIEFHGGFFFKLADHSSFEASLVNGVLGNLTLDGVRGKGLPLTMNRSNSSVTVTADLQLKAQIAIDTSSGLFPGFGASAAVGVYFNLVEYIVHLTSVEEVCFMQAGQLFNVNVGAFMGAGLAINDRSIGAVPTVSTTIYIADVGTSCLLSSGWLPTSTAPPVSKDRCAAGASQTGPNTTHHLDTPAPTSVTIPSPTGELGLSAVPTPSILTITSCASPVVNCPADLQAVYTVAVSQCASVFMADASKSEDPAGSASAVCGRVTDAVVLTSLATPQTATFSSGCEGTGCMGQMSPGVMPTSPPKKETSTKPTTTASHETAKTPAETSSSAVSSSTDIAELGTGGATAQGFAAGPLEPLLWMIQAGLLATALVALS